MFETGVTPGLSPSLCSLLSMRFSVLFLKPYPTSYLCNILRYKYCCAHGEPLSPVCACTPSWIGKNKHFIRAAATSASDSLYLIPSDFRLCEGLQALLHAITLTLRIHVFHIHVFLTHRRYPLQNPPFSVFTLRLTIEMVQYIIHTPSALTLCHSLWKCIRFINSFLLFAIKQDLGWLGVFC